MTEKQIIHLLAAIVFLFLIGGVVLLVYIKFISPLFAYIKYIYFEKKEELRIREQQKEEEYKKIFETEPEYIFKQAKITAMRNHVYYQQNLGFPQMPQKVDEYYVTFLNEDGEEKEYLVSQEFFYNVVKGEEGTLITVNGNFFDFGDGIDVVTDVEDEETGEAVGEENPEE